MKYRRGTRTFPRKRFSAIEAGCLHETLDRCRVIDAMKFRDRWFHVPEKLRFATALEYATGPLYSVRMRGFLFLVLSACGTSQAIDDIAPDGSPNDATMMKDAPVSDSTVTDVGADAAMDASSMDASDDTGSILDAGDSGIVLDAGIDGSICPPCMKNETCCTLPKSMNYGKCYASACLACCM